MSTAIVFVHPKTVHLEPLVTLITRLSNAGYMLMKADGRTHRYEARVANNVVPLRKPQ